MTKKQNLKQRDDVQKEKVVTQKKRWRAKYISLRDSDMTAFSLLPSIVFINDKELNVRYVLLFMFLSAFVITRCTDEKFNEMDKSTL